MVTSSEARSGLGAARSFIRSGGLPTNGFGGSVQPNGGRDDVYTYEKAVYVKFDDLDAWHKLGEVGT